MPRASLPRRTCTHLAPCRGSWMAQCTQLVPEGAGQRGPREPWACFPGEGAQVPRGPLHITGIRQERWRACHTEVAPGAQGSVGAAECSSAFYCWRRGRRGHDRKRGAVRRSAAHKHDGRRDSREINTYAARAPRLRAGTAGCPAPPGSVPSQRSGAFPAPTRPGQAHWNFWKVNGPLR